MGSFSSRYPEGPAAPSAGAAASARTRARRGLVVYLTAVLVLSGTCEGLLLRTGEPIEHHPLLVVALMWTPALASGIARLALREGLRDVSFGLRGARVGRMLLLGWLCPLAVGLLAYGLAWTTGLDAFEAPAKAPLGLASASSPAQLAVSLGLHLTLATAVGAVLTTGEELGWRGYMLTRLVDAGVPRPVLASAVIWACWHLPLVLSGQYASGPHPTLSAALFVLTVTGGSYVAARLRLESGSVWPAVLYHASWNSLVQGTFDRFTHGGDAARATIWTGESGVLVVGFDLLIALAVVARPWPVRRAPREEPSSTMSLRDA